MTPAVFAESASGSDMTRCGVNGRVYEPAPSLRTAVSLTRSACAKWLLSQAIEGKLVSHHHFPQCHEPPPPSVPVRACQDLCDVLDQRKVPLTGTVEDKDPNTIWFVPPWAMLLRWLAVIAGAPSKWSLSVSPLQNIVDWYRVCFDSSVPTSLLK